MKTKVKIVCSWCGCFLGWKECEIKEDIPHPITHSICPECFDKEIAEIKTISINKTNK